jgi:hypothetical protein
MNLKTLDSLFNNKTFTTVVSLTLALYAGLAAPALPDSIVYFFDSIVGKLLFLFLIGFVASRNVQVALMIALAFLITLYIANKRATEKFLNYGYIENFYDSHQSDSLKKIVCDWANSLSETSTPKKEEVMAKTVKEIITQNGEMLLKGNKDITMEKAKELVEAPEMKDKKVSELCKQQEAKKESKPTAVAPSQESVGQALGNLVDTIAGKNGETQQFTNYEHFDVLPADNLEGASDKMYAPVDF